MIAAEHLAGVLVQVADTLVDDFDVNDFLLMVADHTSALVTARAVGVLVTTPNDGLQLVTASDARTELLELFQLQAHQGPCQDCFDTGRPVVNVDLTQADEIWPDFAPRAVQAGFRSVHAFPLRLRGQVLGALNLFSDTTGGVLPEDAAVVQALADIATIGILQERAAQQSRQVNAQLQHALDSRVAIEQAKGVLSQVHQCTAEEAFDRMRTFCRRRGLRIGEVARAVNTSPETYPELTRPGAGPVGSDQTADAAPGSVSGGGEAPPTAEIEHYVSLQAASHQVYVIRDHLKQAHPYVRAVVKYQFGWTPCVFVMRTQEEAAAAASWLGTLDVADVHSVRFA